MKGNTLVELLAVLAILVALVALTGQAVSVAVHRERVRLGWVEWWAFQREKAFASEIDDVALQMWFATNTAGEAFVELYGKDGWRRITGAHLRAWKAAECTK